MPEITKEALQLVREFGKQSIEGLNEQSKTLAQVQERLSLQSKQIQALTEENEEHAKEIAALKAENVALQRIIALFKWLVPVGITIGSAVMGYLR